MKNNSCILGLGNDIVEIDRIYQIIERHGQHILNRLFTTKEQDYCFQYQNPFPHFAGRYAAKEAIAKALGTGFGKDIPWKGIEILPDEKGRPDVYLSSLLNERFHHPKIQVSISHSEKYATAVAIWSN